MVELSDLAQALSYVLAVLGLLVLLWFAVHNAIEVTRIVLNQTAPIIVYVDKSGNIMVEPIT